MAIHPVKYTAVVPCTGLNLTTAPGKAGQWGTTSGTDQGTIILAADDAEVAGKIVVVEKGDGVGSVAGKSCTLEYAGAIRFSVKDAVTLTAADRGKPILGAGGGDVKPIAWPTSIANLKAPKGRIIDFSNTTGDKWVDVVGMFG